MREWNTQNQVQIKENSLENMNFHLQLSYGRNPPWTLLILCPKCCRSVENVRKLSMPITTFKSTTKTRLIKLYPNLLKFSLFKHNTMILQWNISKLSSKDSKISSNLLMKRDFPERIEKMLRKSSVNGGKWSFPLYKTVVNYWCS